MTVDLFHWRWLRWIDCHQLGKLLRSPMHNTHHSVRRCDRELWFFHSMSPVSLGDRLWWPLWYLCAIIWAHCWKLSDLLPVIMYVRAVSVDRIQWNRLIVKYDRERLIFVFLWWWIKFDHDILYILAPTNYNCRYNMLADCNKNSRAYRWTISINNRS